MPTHRQDPAAPRGARRVRPAAGPARAGATVPGMPPQSLGTAVIVAGLLLALAALVPAVRNRTLAGSHWVAVGLVQLLVTAEVVSGIVHLAQGGHPRQYVTFVGYLVAFFLVLPIGTALARMEPTRWGAVIVAVAAVVLPVLVLRVNQLWSGGA
jgi:hypothetical protein